MLAAGVAHEVNTPITGISSYAQMLLDETTPDDPHFSILKKVEKQTFRAARIVNNLLGFARQRPGGRAKVDMKEVIDESLDLLHERFNKRGVRLRWHSELDAAEVSGNEGELQQVFTNLAVNAIDAMAGKGGELEVRLEADEETVRILLDDQGPGIPEADLEKIFQPFYSTKIGQGGTGLGLSISHNIIAQHGGTLSAMNRAEGGCRFEVSLPRYSDPVQTGG
jgi:signal transduction histidine kinase